MVAAMPVIAPINLERWHGAPFSKSLLKLSCIPVTSSIVLGNNNGKIFCDKHVLAGQEPMTLLSRDCWPETAACDWLSHLFCPKLYQIRCIVT